MGFARFAAWSLLGVALVSQVARAYRVDTSVLDAHLLDDDEIDEGQPEALTKAQSSPAAYRRAVATLVATDDYVAGSIALAASLRASQHAGDAVLALAAIVIIADDDSDTAGDRGAAGSTPPPLSFGVSQSKTPWVAAAGWQVYPVPSRRASRCAPHPAGGSLGRFAAGCAKLHLWSELAPHFDQVLYLDADSFARPASSFDPVALLKTFATSARDDLFAAKPVPPTSQMCGGRHGRVQLGLEAPRKENALAKKAPPQGGGRDPNSETYDVVFGPGPLGVALVQGLAGTAEEGFLVVSQTRAPAQGLGVLVGSALLRVGAEAVPRGATPVEAGAFLGQAPRPATLTFRRPPPSVGFPSATGAGPGGGRTGPAALPGPEDDGDALARLVAVGPDRPSSADAALAVALMHNCEDLFNTNVMVLRPSVRAFNLMVAALDHLKAEQSAGAGHLASVAFDSGFLSRFWGAHWERGEGARWLHLQRHLELTLAPELWPYHPQVGKENALAASRSPAMGNFLHWAEIGTVDFSGPPSLKPWAILASAQQRLRAGKAMGSPKGSPTGPKEGPATLGVPGAEPAAEPAAAPMTAAWLAVDAGVPGGDGATRRPLVDLVVSLWVQWMGFYARGCADVARASPTLAAAVASEQGPCAVQAAFWGGPQVT